MPQQNDVGEAGASYLLQAWRATGHGTLPILFLDGKPIRDSTAIIAALEQRHPEPALYPKDEAPLRRALELEDYFDEVLGPSVRAAIVTPVCTENLIRLYRVTESAKLAQCQR